MLRLPTITATRCNFLLKQVLVIPFIFFSRQVITGKLYYKVLGQLQRRGYQINNQSNIYV